jgi:hypothetical protein
MQHAFKMSDLAPEERVVVERLLGQTLQNDESIELTIHEGEDMRQERERRACAAVRIREIAEGKSIGGATVRELIEDGRRP